MKPFVYILAIAMSSCANPRLAERSKRIDFEASLSDTLYLQKAVVSSRLVDHLGRERESNQEAMVDTMFRLFQTALLKSTVPVICSEPTIRHSSQYFRKNWRMRSRNFEKDSILKLINDPSVLSIVPIFYLEEQVWLNISSSLAGGFSGGGISKQSWVRVMIYVVKNNEVVYRSTGKTFGEPYLVDKLTDSQMNIEEEKMDALIALLWRDYLKTNQKKPKKH